MPVSQTPYIGVTDFASPEQVLQAVSCIPEHVNRRLHVGLMTSYKVQRGIPTEMGWEKIWPNKEQIHEIFQSHPKVFNVMHYADYSNPNQTAAVDIYEAIRLGGEYIHGVQLDMVWPSVRILDLVKNKYPNISIILQVGKNALYQVEQQSKKGLLEQLSRYGKFADYFLLDFSMGRGEPLDSEKTLGYLERITDVFPEERLAVAG